MVEETHAREIAQEMVLARFSKAVAVVVYNCVLLSEDDGLDKKSVGIRRWGVVLKVTDDQFARFGGSHLMVVDVDAETGEAGFVRFP
ncbi:MAG: hypothetical protein WC869_14140 [Phycisphaerae bacterium]|jgi:hypothetical protein